MTPATDRFPPSFDDNPLTYAFALVSLALVSAVSLHIVIGWAMEARRVRSINRMIHNPIPEPLRRAAQPGVIAAVPLYRLVVGLLLTTIVMGALPDVFILLAWGEAQPGTMDMLFAVDRVADGALIIPFLGAVFLVLRAAQIVEHRLTIEAVTVNLRPIRVVLREQIRMGALLTFIAAGVTAAKAWPDFWAPPSHVAP